MLRLSPLPVVAIAWMAVAAITPLHAETGTPPARQSEVIVYGKDPCPKASSDDEIVVCARQPESERFRLPKRFRERKPLASQGSWTNTVAALDEAGRIGLPDSCSPVGSGGQTGCQRAFLARARAERAEAKREAAEVP